MDLAATQRQGLQNWVIIETRSTNTTTFILEIGGASKLWNHENNDKKSGFGFGGNAKAGT